MCKKEGWNLAINIFPDRKYVMYTNECRTQPKWTSSLQKILASAYKSRAPNPCSKRKKGAVTGCRGNWTPKVMPLRLLKISCCFLSTIDQIIANKLYLHRTYGFSPPPTRKCIHKEKVDSLHLFHAGQNKPYFMKKRI